MSRAAIPPVSGALLPDPPSLLRAPSRGRQQQPQHQRHHVPFRSYGPGHIGPGPHHRGGPGPAAVAAAAAAAGAAHGPSVGRPHQQYHAGRPLRAPGALQGWHMNAPAPGPGAVAASAEGGVAASCGAGATAAGGQQRRRVMAAAAAAASSSAASSSTSSSPPHIHSRQRGYGGYGSNTRQLYGQYGYHHSYHHQQQQQQQQGHYLALARSLQAARTQWTAAARLRLHAVKSSGSASTGGQSGALQVGTLLEYEKNDRGVLAVVVAADGKKNWFVVDQSGRRSSITPKQVTLVLPGARYSEADVASFAAAAEGADLSLMEIAWEIALDGGGPLELSELAALLFDDTSPRSLYVTHRMMAADSLYFKQASKSPAAYAARRAEDVASLRRQQEEAEVARAAAEAWRAAVAAAKGAKSRALQPSPAEWQAGPFAARVAAVRAVALASGRTDESTFTLALSSLQLGGAGSRAEAEAAAGLLTDIGVFRRHEPLQLLRRGLAAEFEEEQEKAAQALLASPPPDPDAATREDLTHLHVFTVDDASTTEVDDGLSLERLPGGAGIRIWIHVADPTRWIRPGSGLDLAGRARSRTLYLPWGSVPMFPRALAEGPFSLREGQVCEAMSVGVVLGPDGSVTSPRVVPSRVRVTHKLTYDDADLALGPEDGVGDAEGGAGGSGGGGAEAAAEAAGLATLAGAALEDLKDLRRAALLRREYRESRGCIEIPLPEAKIHVPYDHLDRMRPAVSIKRLSQWESASRGMVAEMMILAGEAVGAIGAEAALPLPYRGQEDPELPSPSKLAALPAGPCRGFALKRCMTRSSVSAEPQRHASLALDAYVQFTSPIRRYGDLLAHYNLKAWLRGEPLPFGAATLQAVTDSAGEAGRELGAAERESESYWVAEYLRLNWGSEYPAMVLGWQREDLGLVAFLLEDQGLEVVAKVQSGTAFSPGDTCLLAPSEANPATGFYRFYVVGWTSGPGAEEEEDEKIELLLEGEEEKEAEEAEEEAEEEEEEGKGEEGEGEEEGVEEGVEETVEEVEGEEQSEVLAVGGGKDRIAA